MPTRPPTHTALQHKANPFAYARAEDALERQRFYKSAKWLKFRKRKLVNSPLCVDCEGKGKTVEASEVHHSIKLAIDKNYVYATDERYTLSLCGSCHSVRTRRGE